MLGSPSTLTINNINYTLSYTNSGGSNLLSMSVGSCTFYYKVTLSTTVGYYTIAEFTNNNWDTNNTSCSNYYDNYLSVLNMVTEINNSTSTIFSNVFSLIEQT